MNKLLILIPFLFMSCATIPNECMEKRDLAVEKYFKRIDINPTQRGYVMSFQAMKKHNERYDALADYVNCFEGK